MLRNLAKYALIATSPLLALIWVMGIVLILGTILMGAPVWMPFALLHESDANLSWGFAILAIEAAIVAAMFWLCQVYETVVGNNKIFEHGAMVGIAYFLVAMTYLGLRSL